jgi:small subunit ribosomal protein S18
MPKPAALRKPKKKVNPLDKEGITYIDYKDTALLRKFISDRGKIRARRVTGVSSQQQRQIARAVIVITLGTRPVATSWAAARSLASRTSRLRRIAVAWASTPAVAGKASPFGTRKLRP